MLERRNLIGRSNDAWLPFLTSWDPSDLPGGSVDPLGFDRGYNWLADKVLPGLTNNAAVPRYFSMLCAGASLGPDTPSPSRAEVQTRQECILRLERLWALSNVLAAESSGPSTSGLLRGVTYAVAHRKSLADKGRHNSSSDFVLLTRQVQYGVLGIYGNVANGMRLIDRKTLSLSNEFGETLGRAFLEETQAPKSLRAAVRDPEAEVGLESLRSWGLRAHLAGSVGLEEARILGQALRLDRVRARMAEALQTNPSKNGESELQRLRRIAGRCGKPDQDLAEAIESIIAYEGCYAWTLLAFERILWRCSDGGAVSLADLRGDEVLERCASSVLSAVARFNKVVDGALTSEFKKEVTRLEDVRGFFAQVFIAGGTTDELVQRVLERHTDVQHGKFDRGRRKLPWVELVKGKVVLTMARARQVAREPRRPDDITPHGYRTLSADALIQAAETG